MPAPPPQSGTKAGAEASTKKKKKEAPKERCGCGVDTYRPPPKGKKLATAPIEHAPACNFQRTTCDAYPHLPRCEVCQHPCAFCGGKNRWCPRCYEAQCRHRYHRVVHGWATAEADGRPSAGVATVGFASVGGGRPAATGGGGGGAPGSGRRSTVKFIGGGRGGDTAASTGRGRTASVSFAPGDAS